MKTFLKIIVPFCFTAVLLVSGAEAYRQKSSWISIKKMVTVKVEGISNLDAALLRENLKKIKGVKKVRVSVKKKQVVAELDLTKITENKFVEKIEELGYEAELQK